jgi:hypothetical protein
MLGLSNWAQAAKTPVFFYEAPAPGSLAVGTVITDQSGAGNNGAVAQAALPTVAEAPVGVGNSFDHTGSNGSLRTTATQLLHNTAVAANGGFQMDVWFKADVPSSGNFGSLINYAGTERIQLGGQNTGPGGMGDKNFVEFRLSSTGDFVANPTIQVSDNAWHHATSKFIVTDLSDPLNIRGDIHLTLDNQTHVFRNALKTSQGDNLNRVISVGAHPTAGTTPTQINNNDDFDGLIYQPKVWLGYDLDPSIPAFKAEINRNTGAVTLRNLGPALSIAGYALRASRGSINSASAVWNSQSEVNSNWMVLEQSAEELAESTLGMQSLAVNGTLGLGNVFRTTPFSDLTAEILLTDGTAINGYVEYSGTAAKFADLNFDGTIDVDDYSLLNANMFGVHTTLNDFDAYQAGDLDDDGDTDEFDFLTFKNAFIADNPLAAAAAGFVIPEPATLGMIGLAGVGLLAMRRARRGVSLSVGAFLALVLVAPAAQADVDPILFYSAGASGSGGIGVSILDQSGKGNNGTVVVAPVGTSTDVPSGFTGLSYDLGAGSGSINSLATKLLNNSAVAAAGGFTMEVWMKQTAAQNAASGTSGKLIDYSGTERFQLGGSTNANSLMDKTKMEFRTSNTRNVTGNPNINIADGQWHHLIGQFKVTNGANLADVAGTLQLTIDGISLPEVAGGKTNQGDNLDRAISIGNHPVFNTLDNNDEYDGLLYNPKVFLGTIGEPLKLQVNTTTGAVTLRYVNDAQLPALTANGREMDFYKISSASGALLTGNWNSLADQGFDAGGSPAADGDFDADGIVDGRDLLGWQRTLGSSVAAGTAADANGNGVIDASDLNAWKSNFGGTPGGGSGLAWAEAGQANSNVLGESFLTGNSQMMHGMNLPLGDLFNTSGAQDLVFQFHIPGEATFRTGVVEYVSGAASAVPEPSALALAGLGAVGAMVQRRRRRLMAAAACALAITAMVAPAAQAEFVDRDYKLGESDPGSPGAGQSVAASWDDAGIPDSNDLHDLTGVGGVTYADVSSRPFAIGSTLGVQFDGTSGYLHGARFGNPSTSPSATTNLGPNNFVNVFNRGMQFWVNPDDAKLGDGQLQAVVSDSDRHAVAISGTGTWMSRFNGNDIDTGVAVKQDSAPDGSGGWHHVMFVRPFGVNHGTYGGGVRLYVDGVAIGFHTSGAYGTNESPLVLGANTSLPEGSPATGTTNFFKGVIDDLELFALGTSGYAGVNREIPPVNHGEFDLRTDNEFIAQKLAGRVPGDLTGEGIVNNTDVTEFIGNWRYEKIVNNAVLPDITTYEMGDFNLDGRVNLLDWGILRSNHINGPGLNLAALLNGAAVPEPTGLSIACVALLGLSRWRRRAPRVA